MTRVPRIIAGELDTDELLTLLHEERRVQIETELFGNEHRVTLRYDGSQYYCDTPTTLRRSTSEEDMRACIKEMGYTSDR